MKRIVIHTALKMVKKKSFQNEIYNLEDQDEDYCPPDAVQNMNVEEILKCIELLPQGYKVVFNLYAIEGYSHEEIGELLNIKPATSRSQLVKSRRMLQRMIIENKKIAV